MPAVKPQMLRCRYWFPLAFLLCTTAPLAASDRVLMFPEKSVGVVTVSRSPHRDGINWRFDEDALEVHKARGTVVLSADGIIGLELTKAASSDLSFLERLPTNSIATLTLNGGLLGNTQLQQLSQMKSLTELTFTGCQFSPDAFHRVNSLPELISVSVVDRTPNEEMSRRAMLDWIAGASKLHALVCYPQLNAEELRSLRNHPALASISVTLGRDSKELLTQIRQLPSLKSLGIRFTEEAGSDAAQALRSLENLEELYWHYGRADGELLTSIAAKNPLRRLRLFNVNAGDGFCGSLEAFKDLTHLELFPVDDQQLTELAGILVRMPKLGNWPRLRSINAADLDSILMSGHVESLSLQYADKSVTLEQLQRIRSLRGLRRLTLENIPVTDAWIEGLGCLPELEYLNLFGTGVTGTGISPENFPKLQELDIWSGYFDDAVLRLDLSSLSSVSTLQRLAIGGMHFASPEIETIRDCKSITRLRLWAGGMTDDFTAAWLSELPNLVSLSLSDNCVVTDVGAESLAKSHSLQRLFVSGFITEKGAKLLADLPTLRQLSVSSSKASPESAGSLSEDSGVPDVSIREYSGGMVQLENGDVSFPVRQREVIRGKDGFNRRIDSENALFRKEIDKLEGSPAPPLVVSSDAQDKNDMLQQYPGKVVLIDFWGTWCGPCRMAIPKLNQLYAEYHDKGLEIVGVHTNTGADKLEEFVAKKEVQWPNIVDTAGRLKTDYRVPHFPSIYLVDRKGILRVALAYHDEELAESIERLLEESAE